MVDYKKSAQSEVEQALALHNQLRVKVLATIQRLGAVAIKNSVYATPTGQIVHDIDINAKFVRLESAGIDRIV